MAKKQTINLIVPMAGKGTRMLPHTLTIPKTFIPIVGKPIIHHILENIVTLCSAGTIEHIGFVVNDLPLHTHDTLQAITASLGAKAHFYTQDKALGTASAISCAAPLLEGPVIIAFSDTLFKEDIPLDLQQEGIICVHQVPNPTQFGVVALDQDHYVTDFIEKPLAFVSDLAIIGIYYFQEGRKLKEAIRHLMDKRLCAGEEYQLTSALSYMQHQGVRFAIKPVERWLDCGNKQATLEASQFFLQYFENKVNMISSSAKVRNSTIIPPVYIEDDAMIENAILGPYVSIGKGTQIFNSQIKDSIIQTHTLIRNSQIHNSIIGNYVQILGTSAELNLGDYTTAML